MQIDQPDAAPTTVAMLIGQPNATPTNVTMTNPSGPTPVPGPAINPPLPCAWLDATNLIFTEDGRLLQSHQSPEINKYISKTV